MGLKEFECLICNELFIGHPAGNASNGPYCSPSCASVGMGHTVAFDTQEELFEYLTQEVDSVGRLTARKVVDSFESTRGLFEADKDELVEIEGVGESRAKNILNLKPP